MSLIFLGPILSINNKDQFHIDVNRNLLSRDTEYNFKKVGSDVFEPMNKKIIPDDRSNKENNEILFDKIIKQELSKQDLETSLLERIKSGFHQGGYHNATSSALFNLLSKDGLTPVTEIKHNISVNNSQLHIEEVVMVKAILKENEMSDYYEKNQKSPFPVIAELSTTYAFDLNKPESPITFTPTRLTKYKSLDENNHLSRLPNNGFLERLMNRIREIIMKFIGERMYTQDVKEYTQEEFNSMRASKKMQP